MVARNMPFLAFALAISWGARAFSVQVHIEIEQRTLRGWAAIPEHDIAVAASIGPAAVQRLQSQVVEGLPCLNTAARQIFDNWGRQRRIPNALQGND
ncbi:hypothetical protein AL035_08995 [Salipiger aestuarii]|nr:hypothetical protein AL035_08995 [Salipiger aestuarii]